MAQKSPNPGGNADVIASARQKLGVLETVGPVALFGASAQRYTEDLGAQRLDVEDVVAVRGKPSR